MHTWQTQKMHHNNQVISEIGSFVEKLR